MPPMSEEAQAISNAILKVAGGFGEGLEKPIAELQKNEHRTHQQSITRFCRWWIIQCGSKDYGTDGRNEASAELGKAAIAAGLHEISLPYV